jgi:hypothetical protein
VPLEGPFFCAAQMKQNVDFFIKRACCVKKIGKTFENFTTSFCPPSSHFDRIEVIFPTIFRKSNSQFYTFLLDPFSNQHKKPVQKIMLLHS